MSSMLKKLYGSVLAATCLLSACMPPTSARSTEPITNAKPAATIVPAQPQTTQAITTQSMGPTPAQQTLLAKLPNHGAAPELNNQTWLNGAPRKLADLRGKVVMVEFWTFGCINCQHVIPTVQEWYARYKDQGFEIIGVHSPEFAYEKEAQNVQDAIQRLGVTWPVAQDNDWATWQAYNNHYWPAAYFIDKQGNIRYLHIGEGNYAYAEAVLQALLAEKG